MGFKEDLMKQYRQWKEDPTPFLKGEFVIFKIIEENERLIEELKSQLKEITDVKNALLEGEVLDGKEIEELKSQLEKAEGFIKELHFYETYLQLEGT